MFLVLCLLLTGVAFNGQYIQGRCELTAPALVILLLAGVSAIMVEHRTR